MTGRGGGAEEYSCAVTQTDSQIDFSLLGTCEFMAPMLLHKRSIMLKRVSILFSLLLILEPAQATLWDATLEKVTDIGACAALLAEGPVKSLMRDFTEQKLKLWDLKGDRSLSLDLGKRFGAGYFGGFYAVDATSDPTLNLIRYPYGVKVPHVLKTTSWALSYATNEADREWQLYQQLLKSIPQIESQTQYPKNPAWQQGNLPIVPIIYSISTERGRLLFKPIIQKGIFLEQIAEEYKLSGQLPEKYLKGIREIYDLVQAIYKATGISPDVRPPNWVYLEDPEMLKIFALERPGFVLFEMSKVPMNLPRYVEPSSSYEEWVNEFVSYLK